MASRLFSPTVFRTPLFAATLGVSTAAFGSILLQQHRSRSLYHLDASPSSTSAKDWSFSQYQNEARTPVVASNGGLNARAVRQMTTGSIFGMYEWLNEDGIQREWQWLITSECRSRSRTRRLDLLQITSRAHRAAHSGCADRGELSRYTPRAVQTATALRHRRGLEERGAG
jgi:hypothetical protein